MSRRSARILAVAAALLGSVAPAHAAGPAATRDALSAQMRWAGSASGAMVVDLDSGQEIYGLRRDVPRVPASVAKLYTTSAALLRMGPDATLETTVLADQPILPDGILAGNVYLRGGGDPTLRESDIDLIALRLAEAGLFEVTGDVVGDESLFDGRRGVPSSRWQLSHWVGPLGALVLNRGKTGKQRPYFQSRPALEAAKAFEKALRRAGVLVAGKPKAGAAPETATPIFTHASPPVASLARSANVPSDNFVAEQLIKALGARYGGSGTTTRGAKVVRATLGGFGLRPRIADGSGLSRSNRTTPRQVIRLLLSMDSDEVVGPAFYDSLAIAGRTGTLRDRMRRPPARDRCRGKTGTLQSVSALAGFCESSAGGRTAFAILMNRVSPYGARVLQDRMLKALATYSP